MFVVPAEFNRNAPGVWHLGAPADIGLKLINTMCQRIGIADLAGKDVLDFGCGVRFADTFMNRDAPVGHYVGVDVYKEMVDFLIANATDPRLSFFHLDARNPLYNADGEPFGPDSPLPVGERTFDVLCMFSVITHQIPQDAAAIFAVLRRYAKPDARLFFSVFLGEGDQDYYEVFPDQPTLLSAYRPGYLTDMLEAAGWRVVSTVRQSPEDPTIADSLLCEPI